MELWKQRPPGSREPARDRCAAVRHARQCCHWRHNRRGIRLEPDPLWECLVESVACNGIQERNGLRAEPNPLWKRLNVFSTQWVVTEPPSGVPRRLARTQPIV